MYYNPNSSHKTASSIAVKEQQYKSEYNRTKILEAANAGIERQKVRDKFSTQVKESLIVEALDNILESSLPEDTTLARRKFGKSIVCDFVKEEGCEELLSRFKTSSEILAEIAYLVESCHKSIMEKADSSENYAVMPSDSKKFYEKISDLPTDKVATEIGKRVVDATKDFVQSNLEEKEKMEKLATDIKDKIDKERNAEVKQEIANMYKTAVYNTENYKTKGIFEFMVNIAANKTIENPELLESTGSKFDINEVIKNTIVPYTFLEMVNTMNIKKVDEAYLKSLLIQ